MARTTSFIQIEGIFETEVLGTFNIIRGFATLQDLARISVPVLMEPPQADGSVTGHQRPIDPEHSAQVKRYFESKDRRFIPEIILSMRVPLTEERTADRRLLGLSHQSDAMTLRRKHKSPNIPNHILKIRKAFLEQIRAEQRIRRIDGNHRLDRALDLAEDAASPNQYKAPFCLLLLGDSGDPVQDYTEALVFHTINSTAKKLDGELALKLILGQSAALTQPPHIEFAFSPALHFTRLLDQKIRALPEPARSRLGGRPLAMLSAAARELIHTFPERSNSVENLTAFADEITGALDDVCTHLHAEAPDLCRAGYFIELASHVWGKTALPDKPHPQRLDEAVTYLRDMNRWIGSDGMLNLCPEKPLGRQLIEIYDTVRSRVPKKVFLARWYPRVEDGEQLARANLRLTQLRHLVETELHLELIDMGTQEGGTFPIHDSMYQAILSSEIFIADLTGLRLNVMIELGYALHHMKTGRLLLFFNPIAAPADKVPFDTNTFRYEQIGEAAEIPDKLRPHIQTILSQAGNGEI
jgi:hypothetical protein